jgi:hypothetical protein
LASDEGAVPLAVEHLAEALRHGVDSTYFHGDVAIRKMGWR